MSTSPPAPDLPTRKDLTGALIWTVGAVIVAVIAFIKSSDAGDKQNFYLIAGGVAAFAAMMNGYNAWVTYQRSKSPPTP